MRAFYRSHWTTLVGLAAVAFIAFWQGPAAFLALPLFLGDTTTIVQMDEAMKIFFNDPIVNNTVTDTELLEFITVDNNVQFEQSTGGRYIETAQFFQLPAGVGARAAGEYIPVPSGPVIKNARIYLKKIQGVLEMQGDVMARVRGDMGAYIDWMDRAMPALVEHLRNNVDRMLLGYGNGALARMNGAAAGLVLTLDSSFGLELPATVPLDKPTLNFLEGEKIVFSIAADGDPLRSAGSNQSAEITFIDTAADTITVDAVPTGVVDNDFIFPGDDAGVSTQTTAGDDREIMGLLGMVDDGSVLAEFQGLTRASYRLWNSLSIDAQDTALDAGFDGTLSEDLMSYGDDECATHGGGRPDLIVTSRFGLRSYWKSLRADRSINDPRAYTGGKGPLTLILGDRTVGLKAARKMPTSLAFMVQTDTLKRWELDGFQWDDKTGAVWNRVTDAVGRKDAFYAVGNWYMQLGNLAPRKSVRLINIA